MSLSPGTRLGLYEITGAIGAGGMGEVYRARDTALNRDVAIKVLPTAMAADADRLARFKREAQLLASLNHPNIAAIFGMEVGAPLGGVHREGRERAGTGPAPKDPTVALVMELVEGEDLSERLKRGAIPVDESIAIAKQIAEGLDEAHEHGIVHRDLKPANIKLTSDGKVKILDFGLAKALEGDPASSAAGSHLSHSPTLSRHMTEAGMIMGTAAYMSPEQARGKATDKRSDIWSFGVVLFEMLTGTRLFAGETVSDTLAAVLTRDPHLESLPPETPGAVRQLLRRCLDRDPKKRLRDIGEARIVLDSTPESPGPLPGGRSWRERWAVPAIGVATAALALASFGWLKGPAVPSFSTGPVADTVLDPGAPVQVVNDFGLALSPSGDRLAFVGRDDKAATALWIRDLGGTEATPVPGTARARWPFWSPDGKQLGFAADGRISTVDLISGQTRTLCPTNSDDPSGSWSSNGAIIFPHDGLIYRTDSGGSCVPVTAREEGHFHAEPVFLPGGERFTFMRGPDFEVHLGNLSDGSHQKWIDDANSAAVVAPDWVLFSRNPVTTAAESPPPLLAQRFDPGSLRLTGAPALLLPGIYTPTGRASYTAASNGVLVAVVENPAYNPLVWVDGTGNALDSLSSHGGWTLSLSPDHRSIAMAGFGLWIHNRDRGVATPVELASPERTIIQYPSWSRDQKSIAFAAVYPKPSQLQMQRLDSGTTIPLFDSDRKMVGTAWSSGDEALVFWLYPGGDAVNSEVWQYTLKDKQPRRLFAGTPERHDGDCISCLEISPNGQWLLYWIPVNGVADVYIRRYPEIGPPIKISPKGGYFGVWSADGKTVYYVAPSGHVMAVDVGDHPSQDSLSAPRLVAPAGAGSGLYGVSKDGAQFLRREGHMVSQPMRLVMNWQKRAIGRP